MRYSVFVSVQKSSCCFCVQWSSTLCRCWCTQTIWCCPLQPFQMRYCVVHSDQISCCCVCLPHQQFRISFCNHRNRKVVGGKHNALVLYVDASAPNSLYLVLSSETLYMRYFVFIIFLIKDHIMLLFLCLPQQQNEYHSATTKTEKL